jgi:multiple sugar transport system substrate-binding protein
MVRKLIVLLMGAVLAAGCGAAQTPTPSPGGSGAPSSTPAASGGPSTGAPVTITYLTHWPPQQVELMNRFIGRFNEVHPDIKVEVRAVPFGSLLSTLRAQAASPSGPTIVGIYDLWLPELVRDGIAAPAPDAQVQDIQANWPQGLVAGAVTVDGKIYGYPNEVDLYMLNYNKRLFSEAGVAAPPATWDELIDSAQRLTKRNAAGQIEQQGFGLINSWDSGVVHPWLSLVLSNGGTLLDGTRPQLTTTPAVETTKLYDTLIHQLKVTDPAMGTANASTTGPYLDNFVNGRTAMIVMANWWEGALRSAMGPQFDDVATAPIPVGPGGTKSRSVSYAWLTVVNAHASPEQQAAAWTFLQWFHDAGTGDTAGASAMGDLLMTMGILPSRNSDVGAFQAKLNTPFLKTYVDGLADAVPFPIVLGGAELTVAVQKAIESVEFGQATPEEAMNSAQTQAQQILGQYYQ